MIFQKLLLLSLLVGPASAFVTPQSAVVLQQQQQQRSRLVHHMSAVGKDDDMQQQKQQQQQSSSSVDLDDMVSKVKNFDFEGLLSQTPINSLNFDFESFNLEAVKNNVMEGTVGERGEVYVAVQFGLLACILGGGIPIIGNALMVLLGPCLMLAGAATVTLSIKDLGSNNLSPWAKPPQGGSLVRDGIYSQLRHPQYAGLAAFSGGFSIVTGSANSLLLTAVLFYVFNVLAEKEDEELASTYPDYDAYANSVVGRFFPDELLQQLPWN